MIFSMLCPSCGKAERQRGGPSHAHHRIHQAQLFHYTDADKDTAGICLNIQKHPSSGMEEINVS